MEFFLLLVALTIAKSFSFDEHLNLIVHQPVDFTVEGVSLDSLSFGKNYSTISEYTTEQVNNLLHVRESSELHGLDVDALEFADLFIQHGVNLDFALTRLHYHYKLDHGEKVVVQIEDASNSMIPENRKDGAMVVKRPMLKENCVPYMFRFGENGDVFPLEYIDKDGASKKYAESVEKKLNTLFQGNGFLSELHAKIVSQGNLNKFGFKATFEDDALTKHDDSAQLLEDNWHRYQEVSYSSNDYSEEGFTTTAWHFYQNEYGQSVCTSDCFCSRDEDHSHDYGGHS